MPAIPCPVDRIPGPVVLRLILVGLLVLALVRLRVFVRVLVLVLVLVSVFSGIRGPSVPR